jgi:Uma2 family endonuclease
MTQAIKKKRYTPEEYLALEETADYKSEYYKGEIFQMAGGMPDHNAIAANTMAALGVALHGKPCRTFSSDQRIFVEANNFYTYPDVSIVCGPLEFAPGRRDTITNPVVLVEVLSESTAGYDRTIKFGLYRALTSFQTYVLMNQYQVYVETYQKNQAGEWVYRSYDKLTERVALLSLGIEVGLEEIYDKVEFGTATIRQEGVENEND